MPAVPAQKRRCDWLVVGLLIALASAVFARLMVSSRHPWHDAMRDGPLVLMVSLMLVDAAVSRKRRRLRWLLWAGVAVCLAAATAGEFVAPVLRRPLDRVFWGVISTMATAYLAVSLPLLLRDGRRHRRAAPEPPSDPS